VLERLEAGEIGAEGEDAEVGLVPERDEAEDLVLAVGRERLDGVEHALRTAGLALDAGAVDLEEEVQHPPAARRLDSLPGRLHAESG
jgi:hypothetical protein